MFVVIFEDHGPDDESAIVGPFNTRREAQSWASDQADKRAGAKRRQMIDASVDGDAVYLMADDTVVRVEAEWRVEPLMPVEVSS
jgi:hypothetical protein